MKFSDAYTKFRDIENKFQLWDYEYDGFRFWDYLRYQMFREILQKIGITGLSNQTLAAGFKGVIDRTLRELKTAKNSYSHNPLNAPKCRYLFIGHPRRQRGPDRTYWDIYCDPLVDHIGSDRCVLMEYPHGRGHFTPLHTKNVYYLECFDIIESFVKRCKNKFGFSDVDVNPEVLSLLRSLHAEFETVFNVSLDLERLYKNTLFSRQCEIVRYAQILQITSPDIVFLVGSYGKHALIETCKDMSVPTVEIQHGTISPYHLGYSYPPPAKKIICPDYFFSFGRYWEESVDLPFSSANIFTVGYPFLEMQRNALQKIPKDKCIVLISQGTIGNMLADFACKLKEKIPKDYELVYKLHPDELKEWEYKYPLLTKSNIKVVAQSQPSIHQILARAEYQIGVYSTAIYEGLALGCKTYIVKFSGFEYMKGLIDNDIATLVSTPDEIMFDISSEKQDFAKNYFFASNWQTNFDNAIISILHQI